MAWMTAPSSGLEVDFQSVVRSFLFRTCSLTRTSNPHSNGRQLLQPRHRQHSFIKWCNQKFPLFLCERHLYCAPADSPIRSAKSAAFTSFCILFSDKKAWLPSGLIDQFQENISVSEVNSVQNETVTRWKTCFRQYMKAILFQKKSSERTSSLKL